MLKIVSDFLGTFLNVLTCIVFSKIVLKDKIVIKKLQILLLIFIFSIFLQFLYYSNLMFLKTFVFFFFSAILFKFVYSIDNIKIIILDFLYFIILISSELLSIKFYSVLLGEDVFYNIIAGSILGNIAVLFPTIILSFLFKKIINKFLNIKVKYRIIFALLISFCCIVSLFYSTFKVGTSSMDKLIFIFYIAAVFLILGYCFVQFYENEKLTNQYDNLLSFIKKYEIEIDNQRILRHETKNQLLTIKSKIIDKEDSNSILNYIGVIIKDGRKVKHSEYAKLQYLPSNGIKGLFYFKISLAQDKGINVDVNISKNIENSFLKNLSSIEFNQIGKVLGVYFDNAIEAAERANKKLIGIEVFKDKDKIIFIISNTYNSNIKVFGRSSKGEGRGYGLLLVNNILNSNVRLSSITEITEELYTKKFIIK